MFNRNASLLTLLLCFAINSLFAQTPVEKKKIDSQISLAREIVYADMKRSNRIADSVLILLKKYKMEAQQALVFNLKGIIYSFSGKQDSALVFFDMEEKLGLKLGDKLVIAKAKQNKNMPLWKMGKYTQAMETVLEAVKYYTAIDDKIGVALCYGDIGNILIRNENSKDAVAYLKNALAVADEIKNPGIKTNFYNSLAVAYGILKDKKSEKETYLKALLLAEQLNNVKSQISISINLGGISYEMDQTDENSFSYYKKAEKLAINYGDHQNLAYIYQNLGRNYLHRKNYQESLKYTLKAKNLADEMKDVYSQVRIYGSLAELYKLTNNYNESFQAFEVRDSLRVIVFNKEASEQVLKLKEQYEAEKKQNQINLLSNQNEIQRLEVRKSKLELENKSLENDKNVFKIGAQELLLQKNKVELKRKQIETKSKVQQIKLLAAQNKVQELELVKRNIFLAVIGGVLFISLLIAYLLYNRYKLKQEARLHAEVIAQQDLAAKAVLSAEENERKRISGELHDGLGQLFSAVKMNLSALTQDLNFKNEQGRAMFYRTMDLVDESCKEVRVISHQMAPNVLLKSGLAVAVRDFISKIDARRLKINLETFGLQQRLDQNIETVLYRVIQETVNNVIKHSGANVLDIQLNKDDDGINAMIEDNGKGFDVSQLEKFDGIGLKNIRSRVNFLKGTVDFSSSPENGTLVAIYIPL